VTFSNPSSLTREITKNADTIIRPTFRQDIRKIFLMPYAAEISWINVCEGGRSPYRAAAGSRTAGA
jgi:hypothetical protein